MAIPNICSAKQGNDFESADLKFKHTHLFQSLDVQIKAKKISEFRTQTLQPSPHGGCLIRRPGTKTPAGSYETHPMQLQKGCEKDVGEPRQDTCSPQGSQCLKNPSKTLFYPLRNIITGTTGT